MPPRILGSRNGPTCISADAGCASSSSTCPGGFSCVACPAGSACNDSTGICSQNGPPFYPVCGQWDPSGGFDAGTGPGPGQGGSCASCLGCPRGSECVCGASGLIGGVRCTDAAGAAACFLTGAVGECEVFPGDCATNTQCASTRATPLCSSGGNCVQCLRDSDCRQDAGSQGCFNNQCGACCRSNADCPPDNPWCEKGFCYLQCTVDAECQAFDAGTPHCCAGLCQAGSACGTGDGGADGGTSGTDAGGDAG
jgi:hypothetical protein